MRAGIGHQKSMIFAGTSLRLTCQSKPHAVSLDITIFARSAPTNKTVPLDVECPKVASLIWFGCVQTKSNLKLF